MKTDLPNGLSMEDLQAIANNPKAQALIKQLQSQQNSQLESAIAQAQAGDLSKVKQTLNQFLQSDAGKELMKKLREDNHG